MADVRQRVVRVDIDVPYELFEKVFREPYEKAVRAVAESLGLRVESIRYYKSKGGNTHVYITVDKELRGYEYLIVQFLFYNDHRRTLHNTTRYSSTGEPLDLMFHFIH